MKKKILIVDDHPEYLQKIFNILNRQSYKILRALDVKTALMVANTEKPDLIISDWEMPEINGIDLIKQIKNTAELEHIPVIMCTGIMTNSSNLKTALEAGAIDFIRRPIDEIELLARVKSMLLFVDSLQNIKKKEKIILEKEKEIIQNELNQKNRELTTYAIILSQKNNETIEIAENLNKILKNTKEKTTRQNIKQIALKLQNCSKESGWDEFKTHFENVHNQFFGKLSEKHTDLTQNDLKICAFIRLNMMSKDIANIVGLSPKSIDMAR